MSGSKKKAKDVLKDSTPIGGGFASFFSLQSGTVMSASILFVLALASFIYNLSAPNLTQDSAEYTSQYVVAYVMFVIVFVGSITVTIAAFKFSTKWVLGGAIMLAIVAVTWFVISILSFITAIGVYSYVCVDTRCPPTVWLFEVSWRTTSPSENETSVDGTSADDGPSSDASTIEVTAKRNYVMAGDGPFAYSAKSDRSARSMIGVTGENHVRRKRNAVRSLHLLNGRWNNPKVTDYMNSLLWTPNISDHKRAEPFASSFIPSTPEPGQIDSTIGMSIFCFIILTLFWIYSLWTMFQHYKELKVEDEEEAEQEGMRYSGSSV